MKAPATRTAKTTKVAPTAVKGRASQAKKPAVVSKAAVKPASKAVPSKKPVAKPAAKVRAQPAAPATTKKPVAKPMSKPAPIKPAPIKAATPKEPVAKKAVPVKPVKSVAPPKARAKPAAPVVAPKPSKPAPRVATPAPEAAGKSVAKAAVKLPAAPLPVPAAPAPRATSAVVEPTPRPLGKRAAKKVMMAQMTQAAVVPTHAPDAAKATFSTMNERVMTPPVPSSIQKDPKRANNWKTLPVDQLTDQDVQAMPDSEYMNDVQLAFFRRKLSLLKADMLANAGETTEHLREDTVVVPDPADRATIEEEHALELRTRDRERKLLKKIEQAIARIDSGDYGYCDETGEPIGVGRLMARPTASLSLEAQQRRELKQKMFGD